MSSKAKSQPKCRSFLKWAGGKFRLTDEINKQLPKRKQCLVEPFVGAGSVFLNSQFQRYILADINPDLINLFNTVKQDVELYIALDAMNLTAHRSHFFVPSCFSI